MRIAYLDLRSGISGDMVLGALIDFGLEPEELEEELAGLGAGNFSLRCERTTRRGMAGTSVVVEYEEQDTHRNLSAIEELIEAGNLDEGVKATSLRVFGELAEAEARVHGTTPREVHFHEVGAMDSIIDIVGAAIGFHRLGPVEVYASRIPTGGGFVETRHGRLPVPAPATMELLRGMPIYSSGIDSELVTPTGAALLRVLVRDFGTHPEMVVEGCGYGAGQRELEIPNLLRLVVGTTAGSPGCGVPSGCRRDEVVEMETNLDDMNPELFEYVLERLMSAGALDAFLTPIQMKKGRPGTRLSVLCRHGDLDRLAGIVFRETSTLGIRLSHRGRMLLSRRTEELETEWGPIRIKRAFLGDETVNWAPEYEDLREVAEREGIPLKRIYQRVLARINQRKEGWS